MTFSVFCDVLEAKNDIVDVTLARDDDKPIFSGFQMKVTFTVISSMLLLKK